MAKRELSSAQRLYILDRDGHMCQFHTFYTQKGLIRCGSKENLHVHHIKPHRFLAMQFRVVIETPYNLITLCKTHHFGHIHPDMKQALREYHQNPKAIEMVFEKRKALIQQNVPYWVTRYDDFLKWLAKESTNNFKREWPK